MMGNPEESDHLEDLVVYGRIMRKMDLEDVRWEKWTGLIWLRIGTCGWLL
jgi:hypothetical protein